MPPAGDEPAVPEQAASGQPLGGADERLALGRGDDHCSFTPNRSGLAKDFSKIPNGTGGLEDRMPMLWTHGVGTGRLTPNEFVAVTSTNIAKILNCYPKKGAVLVGADADLVVWDPERTKTITAGKQQSKIDYNVFEGQTVKGLPALRSPAGMWRSTMARCATRRARKVRRPRGAAGGEPRADPVEGPDRAASGGADGHSGDGGLALAAAGETTPRWLGRVFLAWP